MARQSFTLARAKRLAENVVKDDDTHVDDLIELLVRTTGKLDAKKRAVRDEVLKTLYAQTEHFRNGFREYMQQFREDEDQAEDDVERDAIESNAPAS